MEQMEQPETPKEPEPGPQAPAPRPELPDTRGALPIPDQFRLPFHGHMISPTSVPSATERRTNLAQLQRRKRRKGFLIGLLAGQLLIIAMDLGGVWFLRTHPNVKLQAPVGVAAVVFLGMAIGAALMIAALALIFAVAGLRALFVRRNVALGKKIGRGIRSVYQTASALGLSMAVIVGTAWFMIPGAEWKATGDFAKEQGWKAADHSKAALRSLLRRP